MAINRKNDISLKWANALGDLTQKKLAAEKPKGPGWVTFKELKEITDIGECKLRRQIREGREAGTIEIFAGKAEGIDGIIRQKTWYNLSK